MTTAAPVRGGCLCGAVRFTVTLPTVFCGHCHCSICRRNHGAAFVTWLSVPRSQLAIDAGRDHLDRFASSSHASRSFCKRCGTPLFFETTRQPDLIDITLASMDGPIDRIPDVHIFYDDRAAWTVVTDDLPKLGGEPPIEPNR